MRFDEFPELPRFTDIAAMNNPEKVAYSVGKCIGEDMKDFNFHVNFSPVVDLNTNQSSVKSRRSFGNDYKKVQKYAFSMLKGLHDGGALGCAKHFPGIGATQSDTHHQMVYTPLSREELEATHLKPFRYMSRHGAEMIMIAHVIAESLDPEKVPSSISHRVISDILKGEMGYKGLVITDALQMH
jgi:beta-glucosidase-like glycosyl hydrolase